MRVEPWPIVGRARLVRTFRPGEPASREAPFRTLRRHRWSSIGVKVVTREKGRASGQHVIFSALNVDAAHCARCGHRLHATALARAATHVESTQAFAQLKALLSGRPTREVAAAIEGGISEARWPELHAVLRRVAHETRISRSRQICPDALEVVAGTIVKSGPSFLVLDSGVQTYVPRWLGQAAHREDVGDLLAVVTDKLDDGQMVISAVPALADSSEAAFTPFGRGAPVRSVTAADARRLARDPAPLKLLVPVTIGR